MMIIGLDEVGMGSYSGPLVIVGVRADENWTLPGLNDSKKLSRLQRAELSDQLRQLETEKVIEIELAEVSNQIIDQVGLGYCHKEAFAAVANFLYQRDDQVIFDGNLNPKLFKDLCMPLKNVQSIIKADTKFPTVMAASIIAKHYRDTQMIKLSQQYPGYDFENNVGYHSKAHIEGIKKLGFSDLHRRSYKIKVE